MIGTVKQGKVAPLLLWVSLANWRSAKIRPRLVLSGEMTA